MNKVLFKIESNSPIANAVYKMVLSGDTSQISSSGQFVEIGLEGYFLRRPISVCDRDESSLTLIYKVVGKGTEEMSKMSQGKGLELLTGLGNGFEPQACQNSALLVGGGLGVAPLLLLAKELACRGKKITAVLGFNSAADVFLKEELEAVGAQVLIATMDGSMGCKGTVIDAINAANPEFDYFYSCGPKPMMKALCANLKQDGEISLEERMGCGTGICYGCSCQTTKGPKRVCKDGPVFKKEEIIW